MCEVQNEGNQYHQTRIEPSLSYSNAVDYLYAIFRTLLWVATHYVILHISVITGRGVFVLIVIFVVIAWSIKDCDLIDIVPNTFITQVVFLTIPLRTINHSHIENTLIGIKVSKGLGSSRASVAVVRG
jgi:hypothetical protein